MRASPPGVVDNQPGTSLSAARRPPDAEIAGRLSAARRLLVVRVSYRLRIQTVTGVPASCLVPALGLASRMLPTRTPAPFTRRTFPSLRCRCFRRTFASASVLPRRRGTRTVALGPELPNPTFQVIVTLPAPPGPGASEAFITEESMTLFPAPPPPPP